MRTWKKYPIVLVILSFIIILSSFAFALTCSVKTDCDELGGEVNVFQMYDYSNAHASIGDFYSYKVCCLGDSGEEGLTTDCEEGDVALRLSNESNAHVEKPSFENYPVDVCLGSAGQRIFCTYGEEDCIEPAGCLATISSEGNAHVASCDENPYSIKVCCEAAIPTIKKAYWTDMNGTPITSANASDTVKLVVEGKYIENLEINFTVKKDSGWLFGLFDTPVGTSSGYVTTTWNGGEDGEEYYFKAEVEGWGFRNSGPLTISGIENTPPFSEIVTPNYDAVDNYIFEINNVVEFKHISYDIDDDITKSLFKWDFGEGPDLGYYNFESSNLTKSGYSAEGPKDITLIINDTRGETFNKSMRILIDDPDSDGDPAAIIASPIDGTTIFSSVIVCDARKSHDGWDETPFDDLIFTWTFDDGDPSHRNVSGADGGAYFNKTYSYAGYHTVTLEVFDNQTL